MAARPESGSAGSGTARRGTRAARPAWLVLVLAAAVIVATTAVLLTSGQRGADSAEQVAKTYLTAARSQDSASIKRLTPSDFDVDAAVAEKLAQYRTLGGHELSIRYLPPITPSVIAVRVEGGGFTDAINIERMGSRWYLMIGHLRDQRSGPPPAQTR